MDAETYAQSFMLDLSIADMLKPRSTQQDEGVLGASDFGCREQMRRTLMQAPKTDSPKMMPALIGSYCDAGFKEARKVAHPKLLLAEELPFTLPNGHKISVHPDEIDQDEPSATDYKTKDSLAAIRRGFVDDRYRRQRHLQYAAAHQNGLVPPVGITRNVFVDRSGKDDTAHVEQEPFGGDVLAEATAFLDDVLYAVKHGETASKDTPRYVCKSYCAWYTACRGSEIDTPEITDPELIRRIATYHDATEAAKSDKALAADLRSMGLEGLTGRTPTHIITSVHINPVGKADYWKVTTEAVA